MSYRDDPEVAALLGEEPVVVGELVPGKDLAMGAFEGADRLSRDLFSWEPVMRSADGDILPEKQILDLRARDSIRNDSYAQNGSDIQKDTVVGSLFMLNSKPNYNYLGLDDVWAEEFQEEVESLFTLWAESPKGYVDAAGKMTFTEMVRLAVGVFTYTGEILASAEWMREAWRPYNTALQMIDLDRLSNPRGEMDNQFLRRGVQMNRYGRPIGYHILKAYPTDNVTNGDNMEWKYVPAMKPWGRQQIIHIFDPWRPDQSRGIAKMVSALKEVRMLKRFRDIVLQSAVLQATYAATIESEMPSESVFQALGGGEGDAWSKWCQSHLTGIASYTGKSRNLQIDGVKIPHLYPGTKLNLQNASTPGGIGSTFEESILRYLAAALDVSYEQLSRDFSKVNYTGLKGAINETNKTMMVRKSVGADRFATSTFRLWFEEALNRGDITSMPRNAPNFYERMNADAYTSCAWIGAGRGQVDELKETQAMVLRLKNNVSTYEEEMGRLGKDWRRVFAQRAREQKMIKSLGLVMPEEQNAINAASGSPRSPDNQDTDNKTETNNDDE